MDIPEMQLNPVTIIFHALTELQKISEHISLGIFIIFAFGIMLGQLPYVVQPYTHCRCKQPCEYHKYMEIKGLQFAKPYSCHMIGHNA